MNKTIRNFIYAKCVAYAVLFGVLAIYNKIGPEEHAVISVLTVLAAVTVGLFYLGDKDDD